MSAKDHENTGAVLLVTAMDEMESAAAALADKLGMTVEIASTRAAALRLLERRGYAAVVVDQMLAESDGEGAELIWKRAGLAMPVQISFALAGSARLEREVRGALARGNASCNWRARRRRRQSTRS